MSEEIIARKADSLASKVIKKLAHESPKLADLDAEDLLKLAKMVVAEDLRDELKARVRIERLDFPKMRETFLDRCSRTDSEHTARAYRAGLGKLEAYCARQGIALMGLTPAQADDWIAALRTEGRSAASVDLSVAAASSFYTWAERRHAEIKNPFRGTRARPPRQAKKELLIPTTPELELIEQEASPALQAAMACMGRMGLRVGALPGLVVNGDRYTTRSKGKPLNGEMPAEIRKAIKKAGLSLRRPFADQTANRIADDFRYLIRKLYKAGKLAARYSVHDLRHAFASELYRRTRDIYAVKRALSHASVGVTETYLRSIGELNT